MPKQLTPLRLTKYLCCLLCLLATSQTVYAAVNLDLQQRLILMAQQSSEITQQSDSLNNTSSAKALQQLKTDILNVHTQTLKEMVSLHGWPSKSLVGILGVNAAAIITKNSENLLFQQDMLPLMIQSYINKEGISGRDVAQLTDQVSLKQGKKQVFGTQFEVVNGNIIFKPIENIEAIDTLRAELDLSPFSEFKKQIEAKY